MKIQGQKRWALLLGLVGAMLIDARFIAYAEPAQRISPPHIIQICSSPRGAVVVLTEASGGLFFSSHPGATWRRGANVPDTCLYSTTADAAGDLFLTTAAGAYKSIDNGATWQYLAGSHVAFLVFSPHQSVFLAKLWGKGLFIGGARHINLQESAMNPIRALPSAPVQCVTFRVPQSIFAGFFGRGVYVSETGGRYWQEINTGLSDKNVLTMGTSPNGIVFAGTYGSGLNVWSGERQAWSKVATGLKEAVIQCMAFGRKGSIFIGSIHQGAVVSRDRGRTWQRMTGLPAHANVLALAVGIDDTVYAGTGQGLWVSKNNGRTWQEEPLQP